MELIFKFITMLLLILLFIIASNLRGISNLVIQMNYHIDLFGTNNVTYDRDLKLIKDAILKLFNITVYGFGILAFTFYVALISSY